MLLIEKILKQIEQSPSKFLISKAQKLVDEQSVLMTRLSDGFMMARVKDAQGQIFTVHCHLRQWDARQYKCMCGHNMPCVHLIASLISWLETHTESHRKKAEPEFKYNWVQASNDQTSKAAWQADLSGDEEQGFRFSLAIQQDDQQWNMVDILVHLLETYDYYNLMAKDDHMIFQIINAQGQTLKVSWGRLKWLLQRMVDERLKASQSMFRIKNEWSVLQQLQHWSEQNQDEHQIWYSNHAWKKMMWLLEPQSLALEDCKPKDFKGDLREYQLEGVRWLTCLNKAGYGGILADDMGLGKTVQTLAYLLRLKEQQALKKPALIVVPTSLLANWQYECQEYTPALKCQLFHGRTKLNKNWDEADIIVTSYGMVQRHRQLFFDYHFSHLILDEAQLIKNFQSQKTQVLKKCQADIRFCLSGTPMENHLGELWSLIDFAVPNLLGSRTSFRKTYQTPIEVDARADVKANLLSRIQPFMLRRTKKQVIDNLPKKTTIIQKVTLEGEQLELYEAVRCILADKVQFALAENGLVQSRWVVLDALLKLRQICCDPRLLPQSWQPDSNLPSAKLTSLMDMLDSLIEEGRSVLVFSQFTKMLYLIEQELIKRNYSYQMLTGKTQRREQLVERFQKGEVPIFLLSLKAGGLGLNLTKADTVIHYEPWWNPAVTAQATDRIYRIGQEQPVFEYHFITAGSIEESMLELQQKKFKLFDETVSASGQMAYQWTEADIMKFFAPI
jgi:SNF2 family DNA or RNA helicase